jgi:hypothetical protein
MTGRINDSEVAEMSEIIRFVRAILNLLGNLGQPIGVLLQPLLTVAMLLFLYAGWHVRDEGGLLAGLRVAFVDTRAFQADRLHELETAILQRELHRSAVTDKLIDQFMTALLQRAPFAARVRLGVVHNGITGLTGTALLRVDITNGVASAGHAAGTFTVNQPLSEWNDFLPTLLAGKCAFQRYGDDLSVTLRARLVALGAGSFLACPVIDIEGRVLGATVVTWDERDPPPIGEDLRSLMEFARSICVQIAAALDLRGRLPSPLGLRAAG